MLSGRVGFAYRITACRPCSNGWISVSVTRISDVSVNELLIQILISNLSNVSVKIELLIHPKALLGKGFQAVYQ